MLEVPHAGQMLQARVRDRRAPQGKPTEWELGDGRGRVVVEPGTLKDQVLQLRELGEVR